jgi:hypothetical protein
MPLKTQYHHPEHNECFTCTDCGETKPRREVNEHGQVVAENFRDVARPSVCNPCLAKRRAARKASRNLQRFDWTVRGEKTNGEGRNAKVAVYLNEQESVILDYLANRYEKAKSVILTTAFNRYCQECLTPEDMERAKRWMRFKSEMRSAAPLVFDE